MILGCSSTLAFKILPDRLPVRTPNLEFQRAATVTFGAIEAAKTKPSECSRDSTKCATLRDYCAKSRNAKFISIQAAHLSAAAAQAERHRQKTAAVEGVFFRGRDNQDSHGLFARSDAYIADNFVSGAGDRSNKIGGSGAHNDGEGIACEAPGGVFNYGAVLNATSDSLTVSTVQPLITPELNYGDLSVVITHGRGIG